MTGAQLQAFLDEDDRRHAIALRKAERARPILEQVDRLTASPVPNGLRVSPATFLRLADDLDARVFEGDAGPEYMLIMTPHGITKIRPCAGMAEGIVEVAA